MPTKYIKVLAMPIKPAFKLYFSFRIRPIDSAEVANNVDKSPKKFNMAIKLVFENKNRSENAYIKKHNNQNIKKCMLAYEKNDSLLSMNRSSLEFFLQKKKTVSVKIIHKSDSQKLISHKLS